MHSSVKETESAIEISGGAALAESSMVRVMEAAAAAPWEWPQVGYKSSIIIRGQPSNPGS